MLSIYINTANFCGKRKKYNSGCILVQMNMWLGRLLSDHETQVQISLQMIDLFIEMTS